MQTATVFAELERSMTRWRVMTAGQGARNVEDAIRQEFGAGHGVLKVAKIVGYGSGTVQRVAANSAASRVEVT